jgi:hypothetical protein
MFMSYRQEDDNPFAKYNYTRRKRQSDVWLRLARVGGVVMFLGIVFLLYKSAGFRGKDPAILQGTSKAPDDVLRENATLVMLVRHVRG